LDGRVHTIKKNTEALVVASKEFGQEINAQHSKYISISRENHAGKKLQYKRFL
jgi:hypothetical protein